MEAPQKNTRVYELTAALLWHDRRMLPVLLCILLVPAGLSVFMAGQSSSGLFALATLNRLFQLLFVFIVAARWAAQLSVHEHLLPWKRLPKLLAFGMVLWIPFTVPLASHALTENASWHAAALVFLIPAAILYWNYFFYYVPICFGAANFTSIRSTVNTLMNADRFAPLKIMSIGIAWSLLLSAIPLLPYPDGRSILLVFLSESLSQSFSIITTYAGLAFATIHLPERDWNIFKLDPYREGRIETLLVNTPQPIAHALSPRAAGMVVAVALMVWSLNMIRLSGLRPAATLIPQELVLDNSAVEIKMIAHDPRFGLRGFTPLHFSLASDQGTPISEAVPEVEWAEQRRNSLQFYPAAANDAEQLFTLRFTTDRNREELKKLKDVYLWYRQVRLFRVNFAERSLEPAA